MQNFRVEIVSLELLVDSVTIHRSNLQKFENKVKQIHLFSLVPYSNSNVFLIYSAYLEQQKQIERSQPKIYSKKLIQDFVRKRKMEKEQDEQRVLKEVFNYPSEWLKIQHQLPPSLRLIDPKLIKNNFPVNSFGCDDK